jgi:hypothetical protein
MGEDRGMKQHTAIKLQNEEYEEVKEMLERILLKKYTMIVVGETINLWLLFQYITGSNPL